MSAETVDQASEQARFAAREFVARVERELGEPLPKGIVERMLFAFEIGYLRGRGDGMQAASQLFLDMQAATPPPDPTRL